MPDYVLPLVVGGLFGLFLFLSGLADPDKIVGALRLKDAHAFRVIAVFLLVGMLGTWVLTLGGWANLSIKPATMLTVSIGGALLGIGFGLTGYCPGTGLACAAAGRIDALVTVVGMLFGALVFILIHPLLVPHMEKVASYGKVTLPEHLGLDPAIFVWPIVVIGGGLLWLTRPRKRKAPATAPKAPAREAPEPMAEAPVAPMALRPALPASQPPEAKRSEERGEAPAGPPPQAAKPEPEEELPGKANENEEDKDAGPSGAF